MSLSRKAVSALLVATALGFAVSGSSEAFARARHHDHRSAKASTKSFSHAGVRFARGSHGKKGYRPLVSDGRGSGFGFHRLPGRYVAGARVAKARQHEAVKSAVLDDAIDSQPYGFGFLGDSVYGAGNGAAYGVYNGADGYGSPYFAGFYGPGGGKDYGVFGHGY